MILSHCRIRQGLLRAEIPIPVAQEMIVEVVFAIIRWSRNGQDFERSGRGVSACAFAETENGGLSNHSGAGFPTGLV